MIAAAGFLFWFDETLRRFPLRDFLESGKRFEPKSRCERAIILERHMTYETKEKVMEEESTTP
jgi:hypothetical protein